jgi:hypothetical protein
VAYHRLNQHCEISQTKSLEISRKNAGRTAFSRCIPMSLFIPVQLELTLYVKGLILPINTRYFKHMARKIEEYVIVPRDMYIEMQKNLSRRWYEKGGPRQRILDENREWITTIVCICANRRALPSGLIYQAVSQDMRNI